MRSDKANLIYAVVHRSARQRMETNAHFPTMTSAQAQDLNIITQDAICQLLITTSLYKKEVVTRYTHLYEIYSLNLGVELLFRFHFSRLNLRRAKVSAKRT